MIKSLQRISILFPQENYWIYQNVKNIVSAINLSMKQITYLEHKYVISNRS